MNNCQHNEDKIENLTKRVEKLEEKQLDDYKEIMQNNKQLAVIIAELKGITKTMESLAENWKEAILNSNTNHKNDKAEVERRIAKVEENVANLSTKLDKRTVIKNSEQFNDIKWLILSCALTGIISFLLSYVMK